MYKVQYTKYFRIHNGTKNVYTRVEDTVTEAELLSLKSNPYITILDIKEVLE